MEYIVKTNNISKKYKDFTALSDVNINVKSGQIYGLIGRNGAGKTSLLKILYGLSKPTSGTFSLFETESNKKDIKYGFSRIGALIEESGLYYSLTAYQNLKAKSMLRGKVDEDEIISLLKLLDLEHAKDKVVDSFSMGMKQRLGIALALLGNPDIIILDEPINGLDPQGIIEIRNIIKKINKERNITIIISSHILDELSKVCTNYGIIHKGDLVVELSEEELTDDNKSLEDYYMEYTGGVSNG